MKNPNNPIPEEVDSAGFRGFFKREPECGPPMREQVEACKKVLSLCKRTKTGRINSYTLKHIVERACGFYIPNGAALIAAIELGIPVFQCDPDRGGSINGTIGVSLRSLRLAIVNLENEPGWAHSGSDEDRMAWWSGLREAQRG